MLSIATATVYLMTRSWHSHFFHVASLPYKVKIKVCYHEKICNLKVGKLQLGTYSPLSLTLITINNNINSPPSHHWPLYTGCAPITFAKFPLPAMTLKQQSVCCIHDHSSSVLRKCQQCSLHSVLLLPVPDQKRKIKDGVRSSGRIFK